MLAFYKIKLKAKRMKHNVVGPCVSLSNENSPLWKKIQAKKNREEFQMVRSIYCEGKL